MSDIRRAIQHMEEPEKSILTMLLNYHEEMKRLESDIQKGGKQATLTVMTVNDFKKLINDGKTKTVSS
jgi:GGDEF domain-containing protein